ncbi:MAG: hypothetical protein GWN71_10880, partial [Gammaproteobacteria bacterium]|nr:hypothetical protein [Gemmatimonadota bacterium]NIU74062.1 hypothetical protein [Gammaproteobacteria bacterium]
PARVAGDHEWGMVSAGNVYTCALTTAGAAYCWGRDLGGRLGRGGSASGDVGTPTPVAGGYTFAEIRADWHTCAWTADGMAYCWGDNEHGELGVPADATECESP